MGRAARSPRPAASRLARSATPLERTGAAVGAAGRTPDGAGPGAGFHERSQTISRGVPTRRQHGKHPNRAGDSGLTPGAVLRLGLSRSAREMWDGTWNAADERRFPEFISTRAAALMPLRCTAGIAHRPVARVPERFVTSDMCWPEIRDMAEEALEAVLHPVRPEARHQLPSAQYQADAAVPSRRLRRAPAAATRKTPPFRTKRDSCALLVETCDINIARL